MLQEESTILRKNVPYVNLHPQNQIHQRIYPTLNCYTHKGEKKRISCAVTCCTCLTWCITRTLCMSVFWP